MTATISLDSVFMLLVVFVFMLVTHLEGKARAAVHELRMEHLSKINELASENRELRFESSRLRREVESVQRRLERLNRQR
ncbi:MAG: hypothetical protein F4X02_18185 [Chloroflexi bacterium]|nr:hypothetical protein [Chloroflexota bacterium]